MAELTVAGRIVAVSNLDRVLWPSTGFTKGDMIAYYRAIGPALVPQLEGRPVMLARFPEGVDRPGWGQWECRGRPEWMSVAPLRMKDGRIVETCRIDDEAALVWAANKGTIEFHPYLARVDAFDRPTMLVFDLDPGPPATAVECAGVALRLRAALAEHGLNGVPKASGGSGLHVVVPVDGTSSYADTKGFARAMAARLAAETPDAVTDRMSKAERQGRVFIDWGQNDARKQTVAAYSLRITAEPRAAAPVTWDEVADAARRTDASALQFAPRDVVRRLESLGDPFAAFADRPQALPIGSYAE